MSLSDKFLILLLIESHFWYKTMIKEVMLCRFGISCDFSEVHKEVFLALENSEGFIYTIAFYCQDVDKFILFQDKLEPPRN